MGLCDSCRRVAQKTKWNLSYLDRSDFTLMQWDKTLPPSSTTAIWRLLLASLFMAFEIYRLYYNPENFFQFFTVWTFTMINVDLIFKTILAVSEYFEADYLSKARSEPGLPPIYKLSWVASSVVNVAALLVSTAYWSVLYDGQGLRWRDFVVHGCNSIYVVVEVLTNRRPIYLGHFFHFFVYAIIYVAFTAAFYLAGGTVQGSHYVYWFLDWHKPHVVFLSLPVFALVGVVYQCALMGLVWVRSKAWRSCTEKYREESHLNGNVSIPKDREPENTIDDFTVEDADSKKLRPSLVEDAI